MKNPMRWMGWLELAGQLADQLTAQLVDRLAGQLVDQMADQLAGQRVQFLKLSKMLLAFEF